MDMDKSPVDESFRLGTTVFEIMLEDPNLQVAGTIVIIDLADLTIVQQARLISPSLAWHLSNIIQVWRGRVQYEIDACYVILELEILIMFKNKFERLFRRTCN